MPANGDILRISESSIRQAARRHGQGYNLPLIAARQAVAEAWVRTVRKAGFRRQANDQALQGYSAMSAHEFTSVNARQRWANWRTIPRNLHGTCPVRPLRVIDLCCGTGDSTEVLAWHLPPGSSILGLEYQDGFVQRARQRSFSDSSARPVPVSFHIQSVLETFRDEEQRPVPDASVDVVNSSGAVGCHFSVDATTVLAREVARVLRPEGIALIDAGDAGTNPGALERIFADLGFVRRRSVRSCWLDRYQHLAFSRSPR